MLTLKEAIKISDGYAIERPPPYIPEVDIPLREVKLKVLPTQQAFIADKDTYCLGAIGGIGSGKTHVLMAWAGRKMFEERKSGTVGGIFANTYQQLEQATLPKLWSFLELMGFKEGIHYVYNKQPPMSWHNFRSAFKKHNGILSIRRWGQCVIRSMDNEESIRGVDLGWVAIDELRGTTLETFNIILGRVRCPMARKRLIRAVTSPDGFNWIYDEFVDRAPTMPKGLDRKIVHMRTIDNTFLDPNYYASLLAAYDSKFAQQELDGAFIKLNTGVVYHQFNRHVHAKDQLKPDPKLDVQVSWDFNRTPFSAVIAQTHRTGPGPDQAVVKVLDEVIMEGAGTDQMCREIFARLALLGIDQQLVEVFGDPSGGTKQTTSNLSDYDIITKEFGAKYGHRFVRAWARSHPGVIALVNAVNGMLKNANGLIRLYIDPKCTKLRRDLEQVSFLPGSRQIDKKDKALTHISDALSYFIHSRFPIRVLVGRRLNF